jgi:hypothetical protein
MFITIDPFYSENFYNSCKEALKNNGIKFREFISIIPPYNWYLDVPKAPIMVNFSICPTSEERYLVNIVRALEPSSEYRYYRRADGYRHFTPKYIKNDCWSSIDNVEAWLVRIESRDQIQKWSLIDPTAKVWYLGKYLGNRYRLAMITSEAIRMVIPREQILASKKADQRTEHFEAEFNYRVLMLKDRIVKYSDTPFFRNGKFIVPSYYPQEVKDRFFIF